MLNTYRNDTADIQYPFAQWIALPFPMCAVRALAVCIGYKEHVQTFSSVVATNVVVSGAGVTVTLAGMLGSSPVVLGVVDAPYGGYGEFTYTGTGYEARGWVLGGTYLAGSDGSYGGPFALDRSCVSVMPVECFGQWSEVSVNGETEQIGSTLRMRFSGMLARPSCWEAAVSSVHGWSSTCESTRNMEAGVFSGCAISRMSSSDPPASGKGMFVNSHVDEVLVWSVVGASADESEMEVVPDTYEYQKVTAINGNAVSGCLRIAVSVAGSASGSANNYVRVAVDNAYTIDAVHPGDVDPGVSSGLGSGASAARSAYWDQYNYELGDAVVITLVGGRKTPSCYPEAEDDAPDYGSDADTSDWEGVGPVDSAWSTVESAAEEGE